MRKPWKEDLMLNQAIANSWVKGLRDWRNCKRIQSVTMASIECNVCDYLQDMSDMFVDPKCDVKQSENEGKEAG